MSAAWRTEPWVQSEHQRPNPRMGAAETRVHRLCRPHSGAGPFVASRSHGSAARRDDGQHHRGLYSVAPYGGWARAAPSAFSGAGARPTTRSIGDPVPAREHGDEDAGSAWNGGRSPHTPCEENAPRPPGHSEPIRLCRMVSRNLGFGGREPDGLLFSCGSARPRPPALRAREAEIPRLRSTRPSGLGMTGGGASLGMSPTVCSSPKMAPDPDRPLCERAKRRSLDTARRGRAGSG